MKNLNMKSFKKNTLVGAFAFLLVSTACHKSNSTPPSLAISNMAPNYGPDSTLVTITGTLFSATAADDNVSFNGHQATVISASDTQLIARVPTLAGSGNVTVTVNGKSLQAGSFNYDTSYRVSIVAGNLIDPQYITEDANNNLYVTSPANGSVYKITPGGITSIFASVTAPSGIGIDVAGNIYVAANISKSVADIYKISPAGAASLLAIDSGFIYGLAVDNSGNIFVANATSGSVDKITPGGTVTILGAGLPAVSGLAVASDGSIYATTTSNTASLEAGNVIRVTQSGTENTPYAGFQFSGENGIALDNNNVAFVTCYNQAAPANYVAYVAESYPAYAAPFANAETTVEVTGQVTIPVGIVRESNGNMYVVNSSTSPGGNDGNLIKLTRH